MNEKISDCCHDCIALEGELHKEGCDWERCPKCKGQLLSCSCFENVDWEKIPNRDVFLSTIGFQCERCGEYMPDMKMVSGEEWKLICGCTYPLNCVLCIPCMKKIKGWRDIK